MALDLDIEVSGDNEVRIYWDRRDYEQNQMNWDSKGDRVWKLTKIWR